MLCFASGTQESGMPQLCGSREEAGVYSKNFNMSAVLTGDVTPISQQSPAHCLRTVRTPRDTLNQAAQWRVATACEGRDGRLYQETIARLGQIIDSN